MIGQLPKSLFVDGVEYDINSDFRAAFAIFEAYNDDSLSKLNKQLTMLEIIFTPLATEENPDPQPNIPKNVPEAITQCIWFLDIGQETSKGPQPKTMDYNQDEQLIFSAVNAVATRDVREEGYLHWWTFYGLCQAISPDSLIAHISGIRHKLAKGSKLEEHEKKFYNDNRQLIDIRTASDSYEAMVRQLRGE